MKKKYYECYHTHTHTHIKQLKEKKIDIFRLKNTYLLVTIDIPLYQKRKKNMRKRGKQVINLKYPV